MDSIDLYKKYKNMKPEALKIVHKMHLLKSSGKTDDEIVGILDSLDLPFGLLLFLKGNYSNLMDLKLKKETIY